MSDKSLNTPEFRASYLKVFEPEKNENNEDVYGVSAIFPKSTDLSALKQAGLAALVAKFGPDAKEQVKLGRLHWPFRDGDTDPTLSKHKENHGAVIVKMSSKKPMGIVGPDLAPISAKEFRSGDYAVANVLPFAFDGKKKKGLSFVLMAIQKVRTGEPLGNVVDPTAVFQRREAEAPASTGPNALDDL